MTTLHFRNLEINLNPTLSGASSLEIDNASPSAHKVSAGTSTELVDLEKGMAELIDQASPAYDNEEKGAARSRGKVASPVCTKCTAPLVLTLTAIMQISVTVSESPSSSFTFTTLCFRSCSPSFTTSFIRPTAISPASNGR
jgi:hypothetical protein